MSESNVWQFGLPPQVVDIILNNPKEWTSAGVLFAKQVRRLVPVSVAESVIRESRMYFSTNQLLFPMLRGTPVEEEVRRRRTALSVAGAYNDSLPDRFTLSVSIFTVGVLDN